MLQELFDKNIITQWPAFKEAERRYLETKRAEQKVDNVQEEYINGRKEKDRLETLEVMHYMRDEDNKAFMKDLTNSTYDLFIDHFLDYELLKRLDFKNYLGMRANNFITNLAKKMLENKSLWELYGINIKRRNIFDKLVTVLEKLFGQGRFDYNDKYNQICDKFNYE